MASESTIIHAWTVHEATDLADIFVRLDAAQFGWTINDAYRRGMPVRYVGRTPSPITKARLLKLEHPERKPTYELELE